jgi:glutamyl-tRNA synthetase/glutamyl-Q tRNA(Asp) synthetase
VLTRFAPAPTGWLHLGHVVNALYVWGIARAHGAQVLLRIEDHDRQRSRPDYERGILDDLDWLGFAPDLFPTAAFRSGPCSSRQRDRHAIYEWHARRLITEGAIYGCTCSRRDRQDDVDRPGDSPAGCPGQCYARGVEPTSDRAWRLHVEKSAEPFDDLLAGSELGQADALGDFVVRDRRGNWTYQFAVTVDDLDQGIDLVIRGRDLLTSTGPQIHLARRLGRPHPARFAHHALVMKSATQKLSKSDRDSGVRDFARRGVSAAEVIGEAAHRAGLLSVRGPLNATEARALFA